MITPSYSTDSDPVKDVPERVYRCVRNFVNGVRRPRSRTPWRNGVECGSVGVWAFFLPYPHTPRRPHSEASSSETSARLGKTASESRDFMHGRYRASAHPASITDLGDPKVSESRDRARRLAPRGPTSPPQTRPRTASPAARLELRLDPWYVREPSVGGTVRSGELWGRTSTARPFRPDGRKYLSRINVVGV